MRSAFITVFILGMALGAASPVMASRSSDFLRRGEAEYAAGRYAVAVKDFERAIVADPMNVEAYSALARTYEAVGRKDRAEKYFGIALEIDPTNAGALEGDGLLALQSGHPDTAQEHLARLRELCSDCAETRRLAEAVSATGKDATQK